MATALVIQVVTAVLLCAEGGLVDEQAGRTKLAQKDQGLATLRQQSLTLWEAGGWRPVEPKGSDEGTESEGSLSEVSDGAGWILKGSVRQPPAASRQTISALLERGRDGVDLPRAAVVAETLLAAVGRASPWVEGEEAEPSQSSAGSAPGTAIYVVRPPIEPVFGPECETKVLNVPWRLGDGWAEVGGPGAGGGNATGVSFGPGVAWIAGRPGIAEDLRMSGRGLAGDKPFLVVLTGGATLDARDRGDIYGVVVVDGGSVWLDASILHGAVFATETVDVGESGKIVYSPSVLRWATDRSLTRVRLVPGSRQEDMQ